MRVLIIEDDAATAQSFELMLKAEGFQTYTTDLGEEAVDLAKLYEYDAITLDLDLPDISGLDVLRQIRAAKVPAPIMVITSHADVETKVKTFSLGADDYMTKPLHKDEMVARLRGLVRRSKGLPSPTIEIGPITVLMGEKQVRVNGKIVNLTGKEYAIVEALALRKGSALTKEALMNHLYNGLDEPEVKIIDVFVCKVRKKLMLAGAPGRIQTIWGRGYALSDPNPVKAAA
jgi:two-component system cell cycle response regulator CtrA